MSYRVTVSDPQKQGEGLNAFVSYKVNTTVSERVPGLDATSYSVIRRFSDFVWLRGQFRELFPYLIVPALPEKQQLGRFNTDFVDVRHRALQRWVDRIATHPELIATDSFKRFISFPPDAFAALRDGSRTEMVKDVANEGKKTLMKLLKTATVSVQGAIAQVRGSGPTSSVTSGSSRSAEDLSFGELESYLINQAPLISALYNHSAALAVRAREQAQLLLDFGAAVRALGQTESGSLGKALMSVGLASWAASTAAYEQAVCETEAYVEKLADYVRGARCVRECVEGRAQASAVLAETVGEVERLKGLITAAAASPTPQAVADKAKLEVELTSAQSAATEARAYYDKAAAAVIAEVERMRVNSFVDYRAMLLDFVTVNIRTEMKLAQAWERIGPDTQAAVREENSLAASAAAF